MPCEKGEPMKKKEPTTLEKLEVLIKHYGTVEKTAQALGITIRSIYRWRAGKGILPLYEQAINRAYQSLP